MRKRRPKYETPCATPKEWTGRSTTIHGHTNARTTCPVLWEHPWLLQFFVAFVPVCSHDFLGNQGMYWERIWLIQSTWIKWQNLHPRGRPVEAGYKYLFNPSHRRIENSHIPHVQAVIYITRGIGGVSQAPSPLQPRMKAGKEAAEGAATAGAQPCVAAAVSSPSPSLLLPSPSRPSWWVVTSLVPPFNVMLFDW